MRLPYLIVQLLLLGFLVLSPDSFAADGHDMRDKARNAQGITPNQLVPGTGAGLTNQRAASLVKERYNSHRILGVTLMIDPDAPPLYRVRTLTEDGIVKTIFVDGTSGEVFE